MDANVLRKRSGLKVWPQILAFCAIENFDRTSKHRYFLFYTSGDVYETVEVS
jgi:hypothetical protein